MSRARGLIGAGAGALLVAVVVLAGQGVAGGGGAERLPTTCQAVFVGPTRHCSWSETLSAAGTSSSAEKAGKLATERLLAGVSGLAEARLLQTAGTLAVVRTEPERAACPAAAAETLRLSCFPDLSLSEPVTCFADFPDADCWSPRLIILEDTGWRAMEKARSQLCDAVEAGLRRDELSPAEQTRCLARCALEGRVRCPSQAAPP